MATLEHRMRFLQFHESLTHLGHDRFGFLLRLTKPDPVQAL